jgi:hypothetical protein
MTKPARGRRLALFAILALFSRAAPTAANAPLAPGEIVITEFFETLYRIDPATGAKSILTPGTFQSHEVIAIDASRQILGFNGDDQLVRFNPATLGLTPVTDALFPQFKDIALEPNGNILVAAGDDIFRVHPTSGLTTMLVEGDNVNNGFFGPMAVAVGPTGRIFVTEFFEEIWEINPTTGGAMVVPLSQDIRATDLLGVRSDGDLILREFDLGDLLRINPNTGLATTFAIGIPTFAGDLAIEANNNVVVSSTDGVFRYNASTGAETPLTRDPGFFSPKSIAVAPGGAPAFAAADFNRDGAVNGADLSLWKAGYGKLGLPTHIDGNADGDGDVDGADFLAWQRAMTGSASGGLAAAVPEPPVATILLAAITSLAGLRRRD